MLLRIYPPHSCFFVVLSQALFVFDEIDQTLSVTVTVNAHIVALFVLIVKLLNAIEQCGDRGKHIVRVVYAKIWQQGSWGFLSGFQIIVANSTITMLPELFALEVNVLQIRCKSITQ